MARVLIDPLMVAALLHLQLFFTHSLLFSGISTQKQTCLSSPCMRGQVEYRRHRLSVISMSIRRFIKYP